MSRFEDLFETMSLTLATAVILGSKIHKASFAHPWCRHNPASVSAGQVPYIGTSLPFAIISTGTLGCTAVCYKAGNRSSLSQISPLKLDFVLQVRCFEKDTARQIRRSLQCNLFGVILFVQGAVFGCPLEPKRKMCSIAVRVGHVTRQRTKLRLQLSSLDGLSYHFL